MSTLVLRAATAGDIPALVALGRESFVAKFGHMYRAQDLAEFLEETHADGPVAAELSDPQRRYCLAENGERLAGYCKLAIPSTLSGHSDAVRPIEIKQLYTDPALTGRGVGAALMDWSMTQARAYDADAVQLSVWSGNHDAQRFYARYGFAKIADIHFTVGQQRDEEFLFELRM